MLAWFSNASVIFKTNSKLTLKINYKKKTGEITNKILKEYKYSPQAISILKTMQTIQKQSYADTILSSSLAETEVPKRAEICHLHSLQFC